MMSDENNFVKVLKIPPQLHISDETILKDDTVNAYPKIETKFKHPFISYELIFLALNTMTSITACFIYPRSISVILLSLLPTLLVLVLTLALKVFLAIHSFSLTKSLVLNIFLYFACILVLILTDTNIVSGYINETIPAMIPNMYYIILLTSQSTIVYKHRPKLLFIINLFLGFFSLGMNFKGIQPIESTIFQFLILIFLLPFRAIRPQKQKIENNYFITPDIQRTPLEVVMTILTSVEKEFEEIFLCVNCEYSVRKCYNLLESAIKTLRNSPNVYISTIEHITRNMNEQDKIFIEQSFSDKSIYSSMNDIEDVKENLNMVYGVSDLSGVLKQIGVEWNFNTFFVNDCSGNRPLMVCGEYVLKKYNFDRNSKVGEDVLMSFLGKLEDGYLANPYHNSCHAADMMCSFLYLVSSSGFIKRITSVELFSCFIACMGHDIGHKGVNNRFLILSKDPLALRYNDTSVLEMMHISFLYEILSNQDSNILSGLSNDLWFSVRKNIIEMILATDMIKHLEIIGHIKAKYLNSLQTIDLESPEAKTDIFKLAIKCADIGHAAKDIEIHSK